MITARGTALLILLLLPVSLISRAAPATPSNPTPADGALNVPTTTSLSWAADPEARNFEVSLGTTNPPPVVGSANKSATFSPNTLQAGTTYYWRVVAKGTAGTSTTGPIWRFTTVGAPPPPPPSGAQTRLKLMTWNIQDGYDAQYTEAVDRQVALMVDANVDVIGLHELSIIAGRDLPALYETKLEAATGTPWHALWAPIPPSANPNPGGNLVLTRLPLLSSSFKQFDAAPNDPTSTGAKRSAGQIELQVNSTRLNVFFTHLDTVVSTRTAQLTELLTWIDTFSPPRLLGGDFNMMPSEADYTTTTGKFDDAWWTLVGKLQGPPGPDPGYTKNVRGVEPWTGQPGRIDYWFHEKGSQTVVPTEIAVLETQRSDHHPVIMWVRVQ